MPRTSVLVVVLTFVLTASFLSSANAQGGRRSGELLLETTADGEVASGSVDAVLEAVRAGRALRVGWELRFRGPDGEEVALEHWADAGFLTIWKGHVFAQIRDIYTQGPVMDAPAIHLGREPHGWIAMFGTNGTMQSLFAGSTPGTDVIATRWATGGRR